MIAKYESLRHSALERISLHTYGNLHNLPHWHKEHEIILVLNGTARINFANRQYLLGHNMCAFIKSGEIHCINASPDSVIQVLKAEIPALSGLLRCRSLTVPVIKETVFIRSSFEEIRSEIDNLSEYSEIIASSISARLIAEIFKKEPVHMESGHENPAWKNIQLLEWIADNYDTIKFEDAAEFMSFSKSYFSKYFQNLTGIKFTSYLNILKVSAAVEKIKEKSNGITQISLDCGFDTIRNFNRVFKNHTGYAPKDMPPDYTFVYKGSPGSDSGFDPTLECTEFID